MKRLTAFVLSLLMVFFLTACGTDTPKATDDTTTTAAQGTAKPSQPKETKPQKETEPADPTETEPTEPEETKPTEPEKTEPTEPFQLKLEGDSYWVLDQFVGDGRSRKPDRDNTRTDLTLWADGRARLREIESGCWLFNEPDELEMTWAQAEDGTLYLDSTDTTTNHYWSGTVTTEGLALERFDGTMYFRQEQMPDAAGALYSPAELMGVWLQVSGEVEGSQIDTIPGEFRSLVFRQEWDGEEKSLSVESQRNSEGGELSTDVTGEMIERLDQPLYPGCGNEEWSARIGPEKERDENGLVIGNERYVTLLDQNTLLEMIYFSVDADTDFGYRGVSYRTYKRFLPKAPENDLEAADLEGGEFECVRYTAADGKELDLPEGISSFYVYLDVDSQFEFTAFNDNGSTFSGGGCWALGSGGTLLLQGWNGEYDWFVGAVQTVDDTPQIVLYYEGGIMILAHNEGSGGENYGGDGEADTMTDLEGNAFSAPENAVLVFYGDEYLDMYWCQVNQEVPLFTVHDGEEARQFLISCVWDNTDVWIEDGDDLVANLGPMMAGESMIIQLDYPESGGYELCFEYGDIEYYIELSREVLPLTDWEYIMVG